VLQNGLVRGAAGWPVGTAAGRFPLCFVAEVVFFELAVESGKADVEQAGSFGLVAAGMIEDALDMQFFYAGHIEGRYGAGGTEAGDLEVRREVFDAELGAVGKDHGAFDDIFQLADIALPFVLLKPFEEGGAHAVDAFAAFEGEDVEVVIRDDGNILFAAAERWQGNAEYIEPVEEVFAELAFGGLRLKISVGCGDDADIDFCRPGIPDLDEFAGLQHTQQLGLKIDMHFTDLVEEEGALVGLLDEPPLVFSGAGKGAGPVAEELALEDLAAEGAAIEGQKSLCRSFAGLMDGLGEDFFAGAGLPEQKSVGIRGRNLTCKGDGVFYKRRITQDAFEGIAFTHLPFELYDPLLQLYFFKGPGQKGDDLIVVVTFGNVVECPVLHGLDPIGDVTIGREEDGFYDGVFRPDIFHEGNTIAVRQLHVAEDDVYGLLFQHTGSGLQAVRLQDYESFEPDDPGQ